MWEVQTPWARTVALLTDAQSITLSVYSCNLWDQHHRCVVALRSATCQYKSPSRHVPRGGLCVLSYSVIRPDPNVWTFDLSTVTLVASNLYRKIIIGLKSRIISRYKLKHIYLKMIICVNPYFTNVLTDGAKRWLGERFTTLQGIPGALFYMCFMFRE